MLNRKRAFESGVVDEFDKFQKTSKLDSEAKKIEKVSEESGFTRDSKQTKAIASKKRARGPRENEKRVSVALDGATFRELSIRALDDGRSIQNILESLVEKFLMHK